MNNVQINGVGIDVSKRKSTISVMQPGGIIVRKPFDINHSKGDLNSLVDYIKSLDGETKVVMECTGKYYLPVLHTLNDSGIFVSAVNAKLIKNFSNNSLRKVKSDSVDSKKIARYTLDNWSELRQYTAMDETREQLKQLNSQMDFFTDQKVASKNNLISLLDMTYPGVNEQFSSPVRDDGSEKWVDYAATFWHVDCVRSLSLKKFTEQFKSFCKRYKYQFDISKAEELYNSAKDLVPVYPKEKMYKNMVLTSVKHLKEISANVEQIRTEMDNIASTLPEYPVVMSMKGVGKSLGPQLMAEIGDIRRFEKRESLTAYAGVDPGVNQSGDLNQKKNHSSKCGSSRLRKTLFIVMSVLLKTKPDDPVYHFMDKKRSEGKPYLVLYDSGSKQVSSNLLWESQ